MAAFVQYPKTTKVTLPSVESWGTNMNILKDPPASKFTRRIDKVGQNSEITKIIGEDSGDRVVEMINYYARGVNPMVTVDYSNAGTNGGRSGGVTSSSAASAAYLPYRVMRDGVFRPPLLRQEDLLPLSRLPRVWTYVATNPEYPYFVQKLSNPSPDIMREVKTINQATFTARPTFSTEKQVIPDHVERFISSDVRGTPIDARPSRQVERPVVPRGDFYEKFIIEHPSNILDVRTNEQRHLKVEDFHNIADLKKNVPVYSTTTNYSGSNYTPNTNLDTNYKLQKKISPGGFDPKPNMSSLENYKPGVSLNTARHELLQKYHANFEGRNF